MELNKVDDKTAYENLLIKYAELERENRLLGERCNQLLKDKGDLTDKIADIKANCDLSIEGRDVKIADLEKENAELKRENQESKEQYAKECEDVCYVVTSYNKQFIKVKEIIKGWLGDFYSPKAFYDKRAELVEQSEQFLKEIEK